jgi:hypothetical protein
MVPINLWSYPRQLEYEQKLFNSVIIPKPKQKINKQQITTTHLFHSRKEKG